MNEITYVEWFGTPKAIIDCLEVDNIIRNVC